MTRRLNAWLMVLFVSLTLSVGCSADSPEPTNDGEVTSEPQGQAETTSTPDASGAEQDVADVAEQDVASTSEEVADAGPSELPDVALSDASGGDVCTLASLDVEGSDGTGEAGAVCGPALTRDDWEQDGGSWEACQPGLVCCAGSAQGPQTCKAPCCGPTCENGCEIGPFS